MVKKIKKRIKNKIKKLRLQRTFVLYLLFILMAFVLIQRIFSLQIIHGEEYEKNFSLKTTKERTLKSTRGNIYDRNGNVLASNKLTYSVTLEDNGSYDSSREQDLSLNGEIYQIIQLLEANGDSITQDFHVILDENGDYAYDVTGVALDRFRADVYGHAYIDDLDEREANATAEQMMEDLIGDSYQYSYGLKSNDKPYTEEELTSHGLPTELTKKEALKIVTVRYQLFTISYQKYMTVTIATDVSEDSVAAIMERQADLPGVDVAEDSVRVYEDSVYFASVLGYTGKISAEELEELKVENPNYTVNSIVGKAGIEQYMETTLQGTDGSETVYVDSMGKVLSIDEDSRKEPVQGNDVYLNIDKEMTIATYKILEQRIAGILVNKIQNIKEVNWDGITDTVQIPIPIYDVYNALIENSVIDINRFAYTDSSAIEQDIYSRFQQKQDSVFAAIGQELTGTNPAAYKDLSEEMQDYIDYIVDTLLVNEGILNKDAIDKSDSVYQTWTKDETISLQEYLTYAASQNWIDISSIYRDVDYGESTYLDSSEVYEILTQYLADTLRTDSEFSKILYHYMILNDELTGEDLAQVLYEQGVLSKDDSSYGSLMAGTLSAYDLIVSKISSLEITPAMLALDPCSGSAVFTNPQNGEVLACVSYPGYDNNRLANQTDTAYYRKLLNDQSTPFYNKATQQTTAPGSTFKLVTVTAGLMEGTITTNTTFTCNGVFDKVTPELHCWNTSGHGALDAVGGIANSCNVFMANTVYAMGLNDENEFNDNTALQKLASYARLFDLDKKSGIEITESEPQVSDSAAIPSAIGQGTHNYTTSQLARYATTLANSGTSYQLSLIDKVTDPNGQLIKDYTPEVESSLELPSYVWDEIHTGMRTVIEKNSSFRGFEIEVAGKTGTAQEADNRPDHGLFIGYAPYDNPTLAFCVRIPCGYTAGNVAVATKDMLSYYFNLEDEADLLTGKADLEGLVGQRTDG